MPQLVSRKTEHHHPGLAHLNLARFHIIVAFNGVGQACAEHLTKGDGVYVEGRLQVREYEDKDGNQRTSVEVVAAKVRFLGRGNNNGDEKRPVPGQPQAKKAQTSVPVDDFNQGEADDSVPF